MFRRASFVAAACAVLALFGCDDAAGKPTPAPTDRPPSQALTQNSDWTPVIETFDGMAMALVPAGCFDMGGAQVGGRQCFDTPFWIGQYEVTNAQYRACVEAGACSPPADGQYLTGDCTRYGDPAYDAHPVVCVDWHQANAYAAWHGTAYRLPTEAEWEYAASGPDRLLYPWGDTFDGTRLNFCDVHCTQPWKNTEYDDGYPHTAPVGSYPNGVSWVGALDMSGNVFEWTSSLYMDYPYDATDGREVGEGVEAGAIRALHGGSWYSNPVNSRAVVRSGYASDARYYDFIGLRLVRISS